MPANPPENMPRISPNVFYDDLAAGMPFVFGSVRNQNLGVRIFIGMSIGILFTIVNGAVQNIGMTYGLHAAFSARGNSFLIGSDGNGGAVGIAAGDHQHFVAAHSVIAGEDVGGQIAAGDVSEMQGAVGVGPGNADEYTFRHREILKLRWQWTQACPG